MMLKNAVEDHDGANSNHDDEEKGDDNDNVTKTETYTRPLRMS